MEAKTALYEREQLMDNLGATELRLGLPGCTAPDQERQKPARAGTKRPLQAAELEIRCGSWRCTTADSGSSSSSSSANCTAEEYSDQDCPPEAAAPPSAKTQVVGWPPVRSYRKNRYYSCAGLIRADQEEAEGGSGGGGVLLYVKVSMDGAPYLRKMDLSVFRGYKELREALESMFMCFSIGFEARAGATSDYAITYQDKDGDWMLAGDVPWEMFTSSCTRLRVMKGTEARGFGSR